MFGYNVACGYIADRVVDEPYFIGLEAAGLDVAGRVGFQRYRLGIDSLRLYIAGAVYVQFHRVAFECQGAVDCYLAGDPVVNRETAGAEIFTYDLWLPLIVMFSE